MKFDSSINVETFTVSVIIPVYNADKFIEKAVESALNQNETSEVIIVEDGSTDNSFKACMELSKRYEKVNLFTHLDHQNKGAGASRNLGIKKAKCKFIAFLDADDVFATNRYEFDKFIFNENPEADGVYNCIGSKFHSVSKKNYFKKFKSELTTISMPISSNEVLDVLIGTHPEATGHFSLIGLTIKKKVIEKVGFLNENLRLHQDTEWCYRLALYTNLFAGNLNEPVALRGVHDQNRYIKNDRHTFTRFLMYKEIVNAPYFSDYSCLIKKIFIKRLLFFYKKNITYNNSIGLIKALFNSLYYHIK